jgi:nitrogen fixation-related uncharacterized protein
MLVSASASVLLAFVIGVETWWSIGAVSDDDLGGCFGKPVGCILFKHSSQESP